MQVQNLPQNHLPDLTLARDIVKDGDFEMLDMTFGNVPNVLSELIRTVLIPKQNHRFIVADFSAIEARVLSWLAGEQERRRYLLRVCKSDVPCSGRKTWRKWTSSAKG